MTVPLEKLDPNVGGWFGVRGWDHEFCRRENHVEVPEGELCQNCFHPIGATASGFMLANDAGDWTPWHSDCYYDAILERDATGLVQERLDADYDAW